MQGRIAQVPYQGGSTALDTGARVFFSNPQTDKNRP